MNFQALSFVCFVVSSALAASDITVSKSASRQLGFCCGTVTSKCATGCAGKSCDIKCSGKCGVLSQTCGPYTCSQVTNACISSSVTTASAATTVASTTAKATTIASTTVASTATTSYCLPTGIYCNVGAVVIGECCKPASQCFPTAASGYLNAQCT